MGTAVCPRFLLREMALAAEQEVSFYSVDAGSLDPLGVPQPPDPVANLIQQLGQRSGGSNGG
jgi:hypothetical protein